MSEKMLITQALDERDLLVKKINDKIRKARFVDSAKRNEEKVVNEKIVKEEFTQQAKAQYQQILDLIERYQRLDGAIVNSNANTFVETSYGKYSVASAIALRGRLRGTSIYDTDADFEGILYDKLHHDYAEAVQISDAKNQRLQSTAEDMRLSILGKDSKVKEDKPLEVVEAYVRENTSELVDPLNIQKKMEELLERKDGLLRELDTLIKVSNATTSIEF